MIKLSHICKSYNGSVALQDISLSFGEREVVCLIGAIGSGKSTLLRCVASLERPDSGEISFATGGARPRVGFVFQSFNLFSHLSVLHNLTLAPMVVEHLSRQEAERIAYEQLESVGLAHKAHVLPSTLSAGQQQRVAIARALAMKPQVLILDEPLSSLDPVATAEVMDVLRKLRKDMTLVMSSHRLDVVAELADRVVFIDGGRVCEQGTPAEVLGAPKQEATRRFISHLKNLHYEVDSEQFDRPELNARIELYCNRFGLGSQAFRFVQLAVEEVLNLVPQERGVSLVLSKSENQVRMSLEVRLPDTGRVCLDKESCTDELSLSLLEGLCDVLEERVEGGERVIHLELGQERLLLK